MAITVQGYQQRVDLGSGVGAPGVRPGITRTGIGEAVEQLGDAGTRALVAYERSQQTNATANATGAVSDFNLWTEQQFQDAKGQAKPGADGFTPAMLKAYDDEATKRADALPDDATRKAFRQRVQAGKDNFGVRVIGWEAGERERNQVGQFSKSSEADANALLMTDAGSRAALYASQGAQFEQSLSMISMEPSKKQALLDENKNRRSYAAVQGDLRERPQEVQDWTMGFGAGEGQYYSKLRQTESGGRNIGSGASSAFGPYQFLKGTWAEVLKNHPDLGLTEQDRFNPAKQEIAIRAFTQDNIKALKAGGVEPTQTNVYLAHFLGAGGAVSFIRASKQAPGDPASAHVPPAVAAANPGVFRQGRTVADVVGVFGKKFGGGVDFGGGAPGYYADLSPEKRDALYGQAEVEMNKRRVQGEAAFMQRVQNSVAEFGASGMAAAPPTENEFVAAYGVNRGTVAYGEYAAKAQGAANAFKLQSMTPEAADAFVENQRPTTGDAFFNEKQQAFNILVGVKDQIRTAMREDFAGYTVKLNMATREALATTVSQDIPTAQASASRYASLVRANAARMNVPMTTFLPKDVAGELATSLDRALTTTQDASAAVGSFARAKAIWGNDWERVLGDLKGQISATARVIASGIEPRAAVALASVHSKSFADLTKPLEKNSGRDITTKLVSEFEDYAKSTAYMPGDDATVFFTQGQKLAAVYQQQGMTSVDASRQAYQDLVGKRYTFEGVTRIPRTEGAMSEALELAKEDIVKTRSYDASKAPPGVSLDDLDVDVSARAQWVTAPNDKGVILMAGSSVFYDKDGRVLSRSWEALRKVQADQRAKLQQQMTIESFTGDFSGAMR